MNPSIQENYKTLIEHIKRYISTPRKEPLLQLYSQYEERIKVAPASTKASYHSAFDGGYVHHVLNVFNAAFKIHNVWTELGAKINYTTEELAFAAINHDLGKIGDETNPFYIPNPSDWHVRNQGAIYKVNPALPFMSVPDRSLYMLQKHGIACSFNETLAIRLHDGLYNEGNKEYLMSFAPENKPITCLPYILHQADLAASRIEFEQQFLFKEKEIIEVEVEKKKWTKKDAKTNYIADKDESNDLLKTLKSL